MSLSNGKMIQPFCKILQMLQQVNTGLLVVFKIGVTEFKGGDLCVCLLKFIPDWILRQEYCKIADVLKCIASLMNFDINIRIAFVTKHIVYVLAHIAGMLMRSSDSDYVIQIWDTIGCILCSILYYVDESDFPSVAENEFVMAQILGVEVLNKTVSLHKKSGSYRLERGITYLSLFSHYYPSRITPLITEVRIRYPSLVEDFISLLTSSSLFIRYRRNIIDILKQIIIADEADHVKFIVNKCGLLDIITKCAVDESMTCFDKGSLIALISKIILKHHEFEAIIVTHPMILSIILGALATYQHNDAAYIRVVMSGIYCLNILLYCGESAIISKIFTESGFIDSFCQFSKHYKTGIQSFRIEQQNEILRFLRNIVITVRKYSFQDHVGNELKRCNFNDIVAELVPILIKSQNIIILRGYYHLNDLNLKTFF